MKKRPNRIVRAPLMLQEHELGAVCGGITLAEAVQLQAELQTLQQQIGAMADAERAIAEARMTTIRNLLG